MSQFKIGDSVVVKAGVMCPDAPAISLAGWQGRLTEIYPEEGTLSIAWDSITLQGVPDEYIQQSELEGLDWGEMVLEKNEVEPASPRDTTDQVEEVREEIAARHAWDHLADDNPGIRRVLDGVDPQDTMACLGTWETHLDEVLQFPFEARVAELISERGPLRIGDRVQVSGLNMVDDLYGVLADVRQGRKRYVFPLCDLEAVDKRSRNYQPVNDYVVWFANRW
jgi:Calcium binding